MYRPHIDKIFKKNNIREVKKMRKRFLSLFIATLICSAMFSACGNATEEAVDSVEDTIEDTVEEATDDIDDETDEDDVYDYDTFSVKTDALPDYEYPGPEAFYSEVYDYVEDLAEDYPEADVSIPCILIVAEDEGDNGETLVYGDFWIFNYNLDGTTLKCASGGSYPGCLHVSYDEGEYEVTEFEVVEDGEGYGESAKAIFGSHYEDFAKIHSDSEAMEPIRAQIIANYVAANNLDITEYQDYGWDPVELPEENIDSFYSQLN